MKSPSKAANGSRRGAVIDCRGQGPSPHLTGGWQLFYGRHIRTASRTGSAARLIMDAAVEQYNAYRFVYVLPLGESDIFVEDTYYADTPDLDRGALSARVDAYCATQGWAARPWREETGVLPVVDGGSFGGFTGEHRAPGVARAGVRGGFFHPLTSYSLPRRGRDRTGGGRSRSIFPARRWKPRWRNGRRSTGRTAASIAASAGCCSARRCRASAGRFSRASTACDEELIERFYAGNSTFFDRLRILLGKPPVPLGKALRALLQRRPPARSDAPAAGRAGVSEDFLTASRAKPRSASTRSFALTGKRACVIGAGFGGLALAIRLQAAGIATTLVEARDKPGGRAYFWERDGFTFDAGPTVITDPDCLRELWALTGPRHVGRYRADAGLALLPAQLARRDATFDYSNNDDALRKAEIAKISPEDITGYEDFLQYAEGVWMEGYVKLGHVPFLDFAAMVKAAPALGQIPGLALGLFDRLEIFRIRKTARGLQLPHAAGGRQPDDHQRDLCADPQAGARWRRVVGARGNQPAGGGDGAPFRADRRHNAAGRSGHRRSTRSARTVTEVETQSGWKERFNAVASNADLMHTYRDLLGGNLRGRKEARALAKKRFSPSLFVVHFGIEGSWPGIPHHTILFGPRYEGLLKDIYEHGVLPADFSIYLHHPTVTDPSMAPAGMSTFYALVPVAHMGKLPVDWEQVGPLLEQRILDEVVAPADPRSARPDRHQVPLRAARFRARPQCLSGQRLQPRAHFDTKRLFPGP